MMDIKGKKFLVIGGAGLIGSHVVDQLLYAGASHVRVYDNFSRGTRENLKYAMQDPRTEIFADGGDILHRDILSSAMTDIDGVFHLAAMWLLQCEEYPRSAFEVNVTGTMNVVETAIENNVERLVFSSSASVYGDALTEPIQEEHPLNCQDFYGASKVCGEMLIRSLMNQTHARVKKLEYVGLRYMNVYGPRQYHTGPYLNVIAHMMNALKRNQNLTIHGDGSQAYDFIDVRDCARANINAMESSVIKGFYNIGTGRKFTIIELANLLIKLSNSASELEFKQTDRTYVKSRLACTKKAEIDISFKFKISLEDGLASLLS